MVSTEEQLVALSGNQVVGSNPPLISEPRFDLAASWEDIMAMPPKARGEVAEARTIAKLLDMGMTVAKAFGDSARWDLIVEAGSKISRLQVKSAWVKTKTGYVIATGRNLGKKPAVKRGYSPREIDFVVGYVAREETWFVFPVKVIQRNTLYIKTDPNWELARYRERWDLLFKRGERPRTRIQ